ncbi:hypothetical protein ADK54_17795, partial [Streptomyces sp. WM6378]
MPTGDCFCGCGGEAGIGRWFVLGHDITAGAALRAVQGGVSLPERLVESGFGPGRSVVQEAVDRAGWVRCSGCAYAGAPAGLAAHMRSGGCDGGAGRAESGPDGVAVEELPAAAPLPAAEDRTGGSGGPGVGGGDAGVVRVEAGVGRGVVFPGPGDGVGGGGGGPFGGDVGGGGGGRGGA